MKKRIVLFSSIIALISLLIAGGTMAWFTSNPEPVNSTFKAGTVNIDVDENGFTDVDDWVPGQTSTKNVDIDVTSTKETYVRVMITPSWEGSLPLDFVDINFMDTDKWVFTDGTHPTPVMHANDPRLSGYLYYTDILTGPTSVDVIDSVKFSGESYLTPPQDGQNQYQGKTFSLNVKAEAVQASYGAYKSVWDINELPNGVDTWGEIAASTPAQ